MTLEQAVEFLVEAGYEEDQALVLVESFRVDEETGLIDERDLQRFIETPTLTKATPEQEKVLDARKASLRAAMAAQADPSIEVTPEQQAVIDEAPLSVKEEIAAFLAGLVDEPRYDWVYQFVTLGSLDSNEALLELYESIVLIEPDLGDPDFNEAEKVTRTKELLTRGRGNLDITAALKDWGGITGNYFATQKVDDVDRFDIDKIQDLLGVSFERATTIGRVANNYDIAPLALADIWGNYGFKEGQTVPVTPEEQLGGDLRDFKKVNRGLGDVALLYRQGLGLYDQSHLLASIHISEPGLAQRLRDDPYSLDSGELQRALDYAGEGRESDPQMRWIRDRLAGGYRASGEVDKESMRNAVQILADGWNLTGTEAVVGALTSELVSDAVARAQASLPNPFGPLEQGTKITDTIRDQAATVKARLRETAEYKELFEHLAGGESEEEFVRRFESRVEQILGDDLVGVVRNAMRTGDPNAVFQQALHTPVGETSTRFQEILAKNAQVFRELL